MDTKQGKEITSSIDDPADASFYDPTNHGTTVVRANGVAVGRRDDIAGLARSHCRRDLVPTP